MYKYIYIRTYIYIYINIYIRTYIYIYIIFLFHNHYIYHSIQKKIDISHLGRLAVEKVRKSDQGIYSCESVGQSLLGYEKVEQKRWFRLKVGELPECTRWTCTPVYSSRTRRSVCVCVWST